MERMLPKFKNGQCTPLECENKTTSIPVETPLRLNHSHAYPTLTLSHVELLGRIVVHPSKIKNKLASLSKKT